ncbi:ABC transporter substrate-binding protein [Paenibacillus beijingensis]|uniref:Peptide ABC transporter substrate-binding protein n=1 Tax=Paenibacillus beijingensis TaxID=1126833 RepID=A0A0D5NH65_9BACL|nr:ABC transporter substrate-binding protein [Paenibacillus beijingensis]AJY74253.1 peptide ABC transporter substrate-binding protein [Paenibacillus beijingensis]
MKRWMVVILGMMLALIAACSDGGTKGANTGDAGVQAGNSANEQTNTSGSTPAAGPKVLRVAIQAEGKTLDPHLAADAGSIHLIENMYNSLMSYTKNYGEVVPGLAQSYTISEDELTYTFKLHQGVKFHNSDKEVTSEDVKYSINRIVEQKVHASEFELVSSVETPDPYTIVIKLKQPMAPFLSYLAHPMNAIVNKDVVEANGGKLDGADAGSGPFQLEEWKKDQQLVLKKNPNYFEQGLPYLDQVIFKPITDETARTTAIRNGEIDLILETTAKENEVLAKEQDVKLESVPGTFWEYVGINAKDPALKDPKVRQAIAYAIDRQQINQLVKFGKATVLDGANIPPNHWAFPDLKLYEKRDVEKAKQLLQEAGAANLKLTIKAGSDWDYQVQAAQIVKQQLKDIGIEVTVQAQESGVFFDALGKGDFQMDVVGWSGFVDPDEYLYNIFHTGGAWNQQGYSNPEVDKLLEQGRTTVGDDARKEIYKQAQKLIAEDAPMVFLYMNERTAAYRTSVSGFEVEPTVSTISLKRTDIK